jgi:hypothetical protein
MYCIDNEAKENCVYVKQFKIQVNDISPVDAIAFKNQIFIDIKSRFSFCHLVVANNNDRTTLQPHNLDELNSLRIYLKTREPHSILQIREMISDFQRLFFTNDSFVIRSSLVNFRVTIAEERQFSSIVKWVTYGGDHDPRFTTAILPQWFSRYYKINVWAQRNANKNFTLLDEFVLSGDKSENYLKYIEEYLKRFKENLIKFQ